MPRRKRTKTGGDAEKSPARLIDAVVKHVQEAEEGDESCILTGAVAGATDFISTQCLALDVALNMPGIPVGRLTVVRGWESSGKTSLITHILAETVRRGGVPILLDSEFAFDEERAARLGLAREDMLLAQPETVEQSIAMMESSIKAVRDETPDALATIVWDSVGGTPTKKQTEGEFGDTKAIGEHAKVMSTALKRIMGVVKKQNIALVIVNQNKELIETGPFASADTSTMIARRPLQFHASVIIDVRKAGELRRSGKDSPAYGIKSRAKVTKNKCSNPFGKAIWRCLFDTGFDDDNAHFQAGVGLGMIKKKGSYYHMADAEESFYEADFAEKVLNVTSGLRERIAEAAYRANWPDTAIRKFLPD